MSRSALLLGLMIADLALVMALSIPVLALGFALGVTFTTGIAGVFAFLLVAGLWGLAFTGFPYAIALKTGSPAAVNSSIALIDHRRPAGSAPGASHDRRSYFGKGPK